MRGGLGVMEDRPTCQCRAPRSPDFTRTHSTFQPNSQKGHRLSLLREEATRSVCPAAPASQGRGPQSPDSRGSPGAVLGPQPRSSAAPWGDTLERSAGVLRHSSGSTFRLDNLFHFSPPGVCPADTTQECLQTDSKDRRNLTATTTGGAKHSRGD